MTNESFDKLGSYIRDELVFGEKEIDDDTSLFSTRVVNSRNLIQLVRFLEDEYSIRIDPMELTLENFDTINRMVDFISNKLG